MSGRIYLALILPALPLAPLAAQISEGTWKIASITNEIPTPDRPIPLVLRGEG